MRYWKRIDGTGKTTTVEGYSFDAKIPGAIEITKQEYDSYIASLPVPAPSTPRDIVKEFDTLKDKLKAAGINV